MISKINSGSFDTFSRNLSSALILLSNFCMPTMLENSDSLFNNCSPFSYLDYSRAIFSMSVDSQFISKSILCLSRDVSQIYYYYFQLSLSIRRPGTFDENSSSNIIILQPKVAHVI